MILAKLPTNDRLKCRGVSKRWRLVAMSKLSWSEFTDYECFGFGFTTDLESVNILIRYYSQYLILFSADHSSINVVACLSNWTWILGKSQIQRHLTREIGQFSRFSQFI